MQQKTIFLNFYKTKDCFFNLIIKAKDLCAQYICSSETPEVFPQKCSSKRTNTFLEEHRLGSASGTFGNVLHYFSAISPFFQKQSPKETPEVVFQMCSSKSTLPILCQTTGFLWPIFSRIRTECTILTLYSKIRKIETRILLYFLQRDKHLSRKTPPGDCFWNIWKCSPLLFCHFTIFFEAVPQRNSRSSLPDVFLKKTLPKLCQITGFLWPAFSHMRTESTILSLCGKMRIIENPYYGTFFAVG